MNAAQNLKLLYKLLKNSEAWKWTNEQMEAYTWVTRAIASDQILVNFKPKLPVILGCHASRYRLGACLSQEAKKNCK